MRQHSTVQLNYFYSRARAAVIYVCLKAKLLILLEFE